MFHQVAFPIQANGRYLAEEEVLACCSNTSEQS